MEIYLRITVNKNVAEIRARRKCQAERWNNAAGRAGGQTEIAKSINAWLDVLQRKVYDYRKQLADNEKPITVDNLKRLLIGQELDAHKYMLMEIFKQHNDRMAALDGREYAAGTLHCYETSFRHTASFIQYKYKVGDLDITRLNYEFMAEYEFWLKSVRKCDHNSTMK